MSRKTPLRPSATGGSYEQPRAKDPSSPCCLQIEGLDLEYRPILGPELQLRIIVGVGVLECAKVDSDSLCAKPVLGSVRTAVLANSASS